jgi:hypothetical protein
VKTSTFVGISDPGWADFGVTPDAYALVEVGSALNPAPVDSNRAVDGVSSQRPLVDVAKQLQAKGPLNVYAAQSLERIDATARDRIAREIANNADPKQLVNALFGGSVAPGCGTVFGS